MKYFGQAETMLASLNPAELSKAFSDDIIVIDSTTPIPNGIAPDKCIVLVQDALAEDVVKLTKTKSVRHVVQITRPDFEKELNIAARLITNNDDFLKDPKEFLNIKGKDLYIEFRSSDQKAAVKKQIQDFINSIPPLRTLASGAMVIVDELFSNALFDAPTDKYGKRKFNALPRNSKVELDPGQKAEFIFSYNDNKLLIAARDPFGSMNENKFLERLQICYSGDTINDINMTDGGAGIGCRMLFEHSMTLYIGVKKWFCTVTCCVLALGPNDRAIQRIPKNIQVSVKK